MKKRLLSGLFAISLLGLTITACDKVETTDAEANETAASSEVILEDFGGNPLVINIEDYTLENDNFRTAIWTGEFLQLTVMSIPVGGEIGLEVHHDIDQFLRIEQGKGQVYMGDAEDNLDFTQIVEDDFAVLVPAGKWHNIKNIGDEVLKVYSIYGPAEHPHGTVHKTIEDDVH